MDSLGVEEVRRVWTTSKMRIAIETEVQVLAVAECLISREGYDE